MDSSIDVRAAEDLLYREALYLDRRDWDKWLELYTEDAVYWSPAWRNESEPTENPDSELSFVYYKGRRGLEERVWRIRSGQSVASTPLPRSVHSVTGVIVESTQQDTAAVAASFANHVYDVRSGRTNVFFGRYEYVLRQSGDALRIASKKIFLLNDVIPTVVDVYSL